MPTPTEELLWNAVKQKKYDDIQEIIESHPDEALVNSIHPTYGTSLLMHIVQTTNSASEKPRKLLEYLLTHPKVQWDFKHVKIKGFTLIDTILATADVELIKCLKDVPQFLVADLKLTYELAAKKRTMAINANQAEIKKGASGESIERNEKRINSLEEIVSIIRDMTILHAIKTDDADLFDRLEKAGGDPTDFLGDFGSGKLPTALLKSTNINLRAWLAVERKKTTVELVDSRHSFFADMQKMNDTQEQIKQINATYDAKATGILAGASIDRENRMSATISQLS